MALPKASSVDQLLSEATKLGASDIHISTGASPKYRLYGNLKEMNYETLTGSDTSALFSSLLDAYARRVLESDGQWDMSYSISGVGRFRVNIFKQKGALSGVFRFLNNNVPEFSTLGLPLTVFNLSKRRRGLVLVTGPTGSGKTTTLASVIDTINKNYYKHIITLEDPIEYLHWHARCNISQREVGSDVSSFESGLRAALREDPDVIMVGEMRDLETMTTALMAAETGHLVVSTLHTIGAVETINRILDTFPESSHAQVRSQLVTTVEAVVSQQLLPKIDGNGFICAYEIMTRNKTVQRLISEGKTSELSDYIKSDDAKNDGMCSMDETIVSLFKRGLISKDVAIDYAIDKKYVSHELH